MVIAPPLRFGQQFLAGTKTAPPAGRPRPPPSPGGAGGGGDARCRRAPPTLDSPGTSVVCLGDSITAGVGASEGHAYPVVLAERLGREVINGSLPPDTAADGLARLPQVLAQDPWLVIVELGGNDILRQVPIERTEEALAGIVPQLLAAPVL